MSKVNTSIRVYRNELKYLISYQEYTYLKKVFNTVLTRDLYGNSDGDYWIRSLYFDTIYQKDYFEKVIGVKERKKVRLRIYDTNDEKIKLEIKNRYDQYMLKETAIISKEDANQLINGNKEVILKYNNSTLNKLYYIMQQDYYTPSMMIDYEREAYVYPMNSIRITFDKNIRASNSDFNLFNKNINTVNIFQEPLIVLEVKFNKMLPKFIKEILSSCTGDKLSISKYCLAQELFNK